MAAVMSLSASREVCLVDSVNWLMAWRIFSLPGVVELLRARMAADPCVVLSKVAV